MVNVFTRVVLSTDTGSKFGFMGRNDWEAALINETAEIGDDLFRPMAESVFSSNEARKAELRKALPEVIIPKTIKLLEMRLKENGNNGFFVGDKLSLADVAIFVLLQPMMENPDLAAAFKDHCAITEHVKRIGAIPAIKKWVGIRPKTPI
ncbi:PREDICTED: glutathione S-transferase 1-like [Priapulus caudatus]|uniref:Glutathione S-transferase 1-like n=1 Tax=Priapulus caudatus TaxID=37621 RepID=A0ABM1EZG5_PRICU|nr:PREDICTED: glutathione S-transferase 1-like [Priapulus caudatus]